MSDSYGITICARTGDRDERMRNSNGQQSGLEKIRGPKKPSETTVCIRVIIQEMQTQGIRIHWYWVQAHMSNRGNKKADELAKQAANDKEATVGFNIIPLSVNKSKTKAELKLKWQAR